MKEQKRYKGMQSFGIGVLLLGASAVLSLLRTSTLMMTAMCSAAAVGEFLMAYGALAAGKYAKGFRSGGVLLLLAAILRTAGPLIHMLELADTVEKLAVLEASAATLAALLDAIGVMCVMAGCMRVDNERQIGKSLAVISFVLYPVIFLFGQALPILLAVRYAGERQMVLSGIMLVAILVFLTAFLAAAASQSAFRKIETEYTPDPGKRRHVERPDERRSQRSTRRRSQETPSRRRR